MAVYHETTGEMKRASLLTDVFEWLEAIAIALAIVATVFTFFFRIVRVNGESMSPTLHEEDRVLVNCSFYTPKDGDVVVIVGLYQEDPDLYERPIVKRIIATEGEIVDINESGRVIVTLVDATVREEGSSFDLISPDRRGEHAYPYEVAPGCVFVMGDNRNNSLDSRKKVIGMVKIEHILGKVDLRLIPFDSFGKID